MGGVGGNSDDGGQMDDGEDSFDDGGFGVALRVNSLRTLMLKTDEGR
jgi:hypothetical protein